MKSGALDEQSTAPLQALGECGCFFAVSELSGSFRKGQLVRHPTFGMGRITEISDMGQHTRAIIDFNQVGRKTLILQYARLEAVG